MKLIIEKSIKAILFGVEENVVGTLKFGNNYTIKKDSLINKELYKEFDYTPFGIKRIYYSAILNDDLEVAILEKKEAISIQDAVFINGTGYFINGKEIDEYIYELEESEKQYIDKQIRLIRLSQDNAINIKELLINTNIKEENGEAAGIYNSKIPFPDIIDNTGKKLNLDEKDKISYINEFLKNTDLSFSDSKFNSDLLSMACFLYDQTYTANTPTLRFMVGVIGLESLLVDGHAELSYKLSRNCAMLLSENATDYFVLYKKIRCIYDKRSSFVHDGIIQSLTEDDIYEVRKILRDTIFKITELNITKDELLRKLDLKGYNG